MLCLTGSWVALWAAPGSLNFSCGVIPRAQHPDCLHSAPTLHRRSRQRHSMDYNYGNTPRAVVSTTCVHRDLVTLMQPHLHRMEFLERKRSTTSQERQQCSKILAKCSSWRVTFAELVWRLPENWPWIISKILRCAHYLEDYSWCAVSS